MPITLKGTNVTITDSLTDYVTKRLLAVKRFTKGKEDVLVEVELAKLTKHHQKGNIFYAELNLKVEGNLLRASAEAESLEEAIDAVRDDILRELRKEKTRRTSKARQEEGKAKRAIRGE